MQSRLLVNHHMQKNRREESKRFRLFVLAQFIQYGALALLLMGGLFFILVALRAFF